MKETPDGGDGWWEGRWFNTIKEHSSPLDSNWEIIIYEERRVRDENTAKVIPTPRHALINSYLFSINPSIKTWWPVIHPFWIIPSIFSLAQLSCLFLHHRSVNWVWSCLNNTSHSLYLSRQRRGSNERMFCLPEDGWAMETSFKNKTPVLSLLLLLLSLSLSLHTITSVTPKTNMFLWFGTVNGAK